MPKFVIDTCADTTEGQKKYLASFFRDVFDLNGYVIAVGGSRHWSEINGKASLLNVIQRLKDCGRIQLIETAVVDAKESELRERTQARLGHIPACCDDFHLLAVCLLADCRNVITVEQRLRDCVDEIRSKVGHRFCPNIRLIRDEATYLSLKNHGQL